MRETPGRGRFSRLDLPIEEERDDHGRFARLSDRILENPIRSGAIFVAGLAVAVIIANAVFLQNGKHPAPLFATRPDLAAPATKVAAAPSNASRPASGAPAPVAVKTQALPVTRTDPVPVLAGDDPAVVTVLQKGLAAIGVYDGPADGIAGTKTRAAIKAYQGRAGLAQTGEPSQVLADQVTAAAATARAAPAPAPPATTGSVKPPDDRLKAVQVALNQIGYGPVRVDGQTDSASSSAIRRFELDNGLPLTGAAGDAVVKRLVQIGAMQPI